MNPLEKEVLVRKLATIVDHDEPPGLASRELARSALSLLDSIYDQKAALVLARALDDFRFNFVVSVADVDKSVFVFALEEFARSAERLSRAWEKDHDAGQEGYPFGEVSFDELCVQIRNWLEKQVR